MSQVQERGYFLSELVTSRETAKAALNVLTPHFGKGQQKLGEVVIGTEEIQSEVERDDRRYSKGIIRRPYPRVDQLTPFIRA
jgi:hypothetical protein